jgi:Na+/phosphate symporter
MSRAQKLAVYFSYGAREKALSDIAKGKLSSSSPDVKLKLDLNITRIASERMLLYSILRMKRALKIYLIKIPDTNVIKEDDRNSWMDFEVVLNITQMITK